MDSMLRKVYEVLKNNSRNADFLDLVQKDLIETEIELTENKIEKSPKVQYRKYLKFKIEEAALKYLISQQNERKRKK